MIPLRRLPEPAILVQKGAAWLTKYLERRALNPGERPSSSQYAHREIVAALAAMSGWKCFYCERSLKGEVPEVDHYIEVAELPEGAFTWINLYLSCKGCNGKLTNQQIPAAACLDPCAAGCLPGEHLTFDDEVIRPRAGSRVGDQTIRKYKLDRERLDYLRIKQLKLFIKTHQELTERARADGGRPLTEREREILRGFGDASQPFSLMFREYLAALGL